MRTDLKSSVVLVSALILLFTLHHQSPVTMSSSSSNVVFFDLPSKQGISWSLNPWKSKTIFLTLKHKTC